MLMFKTCDLTAICLTLNTRTILHSTSKKSAAIGTILPSLRADRKSKTWAKFESFMCVWQMLYKDQHRSFGDLKHPSRGKALISFMVAQHFCNTRNKELPSSSIVCFTMTWFDFQADLREFISSKSNACKIHNSTSISQTAVNTPSILHASMEYSSLILLYQATDFFTFLVIAMSVSAHIIDIHYVNIHVKSGTMYS